MNMSATIYALTASLTVHWRNRIHNCMHDIWYESHAHKIHPSLSLILKCEFQSFRNCIG